MNRMRKRFLIYEKDHTAVDFLRSFFKKRGKEYEAVFIDTIPALKETFSQGGSNASLWIISSHELDRIDLSPLDGSVIATIPKNHKAEIHRSGRQGIDTYLISPFYEEDLEVKIESVMKRRETLDHLKKETATLQAIIELTYLVSSTLDPQEILYLIVKKISELIPVTRCSIIRVDGKIRYARVVSTFEDPKLRNIRLDLNKYPEIKKALTSKKPVIIKDVKSDPLMTRVRKIIFPLGISSIIVIPIVFHEEVIGTLFLRTSRSRSAFSEQEITLCSAIANVSANSLYNAFLFEKVEDEKARLEKLAITDFLTGVYNIRYFYHRLTEEFSRSERYGLSLSCLMLDIDHFKDINDKYGHRIGDLVLREFAQLLRRHTRKSDVLARYGGEEFIMLLAQTSAEGAMLKAEALRNYVETSTFRGLHQGRCPTVSIGVASFPNPSVKNKEDLITFADNALYAAKTAGRNQVVSFKD